MPKKFLVSLTALALFLGVGAIAMADTKPVGTLVINQLGAQGAVKMVEPDGSTGTTYGDFYSETTVPPGSITISPTAPAGFVLDSVKDGANAVLQPPYTQVLAAGSTVTYNVNYVAAPATTTPPSITTPPSVTTPPSTTTAITLLTIKDKAATCAAMKNFKAKLACMRELSQMKRDYQNSLKQAAMDAIKAKQADCAKLAAGKDKKKCLADLAALLKAYNKSYSHK